MTRDQLTHELARESAAAATCWRCGDEHGAAAHLQTVEAINQALLRADREDSF